jgi:F0F1-type ATP synthase membrane subunit b/b'
MVVMRHLILLSALLLAGCVAPAIQKTDDALRARIEQMEVGVSRIKSEAVSEAKKAASDLVTQASKDLQKTGEALIDKAADRIDDQRVKVTADLREVLKTDVPKAVGDAVVGAADKVAERLGAVKKTGTDEEGNPITWWVLGTVGGGGAIGGLFSMAKTAYRVWTAKKREDEEDEWFEEKLAKKVGSDGKVKVAHEHCATCSGPAHAPPAG